MTRRHYYASRRFTKLMKCRASSVGERRGAFHDIPTAARRRWGRSDPLTLTDTVRWGLESWTRLILYRPVTMTISWKSVYTHTDGRIDVASGPDPVASLSEKSLCVQPLFFFLLFYLFKKRRRRILMMITFRDFGGWLGGLWDAATNVEWGGRNQFPFLRWLSI